MVIYGFSGSALVMSTPEKAKSKMVALTVLFTVAYEAHEVCVCATGATLLGSGCGSR